jgi:hypothetical protein
VPPVHQLGDHAAHGIAHGGELAGTEDRRQRGDIVGAILEPEPRPGPDPVAVAAQVGGDDTEMSRQGREDLPPVQLGRARQPVDEHECLTAGRTGTLPHPGDSTAGQLYQACNRGRFLSKHLPHCSHSPAMPVSESQGPRLG